MPTAASPPAAEARIARCLAWRSAAMDSSAWSLACASDCGGASSSSGSCASSTATISCRPSQSASGKAISTAIANFPPTPVRTHTCARRVRLLSPAARRRADAGATEGARRNAMARALSSLACRHAARLRSLYVVLFVDLGSALLVRPQPTRRLYRRLSRRTRSPARQPVQRQRNDYRALRTASCATRILGGGARGLPPARRWIDLRHHPPDRTRR